MSNFFEESLTVADPEIEALIHQEMTRQQNHIELIASENIVSKAVLQAMGSVFTNKYAEGYPGKRYYHGCEYADGVELLSLLFSLESSPHDKAVALRQPTKMAMRKLCLTFLEV